MKRAPVPQLITHWATQSARDPAALARDAATLDPRSFAELVADAAHIAGFVPFVVDDSGNANDSWQDLLAADPVILLALIAAIDVEERTATLRAILHKAENVESDRQREILLRRTLKNIMQLARELDASLEPIELAGHDRHNVVQRRIATAIDHELGPRLRDFLAYAAAVERAGMLADRLVDADDFPGDRWRLYAVEAELAHLHHAIEHDMVAALLIAAIELGWAFLREIGAIAAASRAALGDCLDRADHAPHIALILAFAQLFRHAQDRLNDVPQRLVDFYYNAVLRQQPRGAAPDRVFLSVTPQPGAHPLVPAGASFPAGKDAAGKPIIFAADTDLPVTGTVPLGVRRWTPTLDGGTLTRVDAAWFAAGEQGALGDPTGGVTGDGTALTVEPALIVATPVLDLPSGTRRIRIKLGVAPLPAERSPVLPALLAAALRAEVSTAAGWISAGDIMVTSDAVDKITITITLDEKAPPVVSLPNTTLGPAVRLAMRQDAGVKSAPLALLTGVQLSGIAVAVQVKGLADFTIETPAGPADPAGFLPFGAQPFVGAALRIEHPAFRRAPLHRLAIGLSWAAVPNGKYGFAGYYRDYVVDEDRTVRTTEPIFTNASFTVRIDGPIRGWDAARDVSLFAVGAPIAHDVLVPDGEFVVASGTMPPLPRGGTVAPTTWFAVGGTGARVADAPDHLVLTLSGPREGFGAALYPLNVAYASAALAKNATHGPSMPDIVEAETKKIGSAVSNALVALHLKKAHDAPPPAPALARVALPNPPWQPMLAGVTIDYAVQVDAGDGDDAPRLFHDLPFDAMRAIDPNAGAPFLPALSIQPMLDFALAGLAPAMAVSLLVQVGAGPARSVAPQWRYRRADGWAPLPDAAVIADSSRGLSATGILTIAPPADAMSDRDGALWLRAILPVGAMIPQIRALTADVLSATRVLTSPAAPLVPIPAGTIRKLPGLAGVASVGQPLAALGGRDPDALGDVRRRTAERLQHRGRGVTAWDIERLVLADFPAIAKVRVLDGATVVVIPRADVEGVDPRRPRASAALRDAITAHLAALSSPFARLTVADPEYVPLDISGAVIVRTGSDAADALPRDLAAFLSPLSDTLPSLSPSAGEDELRVAVAEFVGSLPYVAGIERLHVTVAATPLDVMWRIPVAGAIDLVTLSADSLASAT